MFDILVGTVIKAEFAVPMISQLNPRGFECYELDFNSYQGDFSKLSEHAKQVKEVLDGKKISSLGIYGNTMCDESIAKKVELMIQNAAAYDCNTVCVFAGGDPTKSVPDNMPLFKKVFEPLAKLAEEHHVKIGFENCGGGWDRGCTNIAFGPDCWELMFHEVPSDALGLEWEPAHQLCALMDPVAQLRKWAKKVVHLHGKDATVAWDVIREHGIHGAVPYAWHRQPGFGDSNWADLITILLQAGYEGAIDIEGYHDPVHYDDMEWTSQLVSLEYLKRCRGGVEYFEGPAEYRGYQGKRKAGNGGNLL